MSIPAIGLLLMCQEPEPFYNKIAVPPEEYPLEADGIREGQHLTGLVSFCFTPEIPASRISFVTVSVDDQMIYSLDCSD